MVTPMSRTRIDVQVVKPAVRRPRSSRRTAVVADTRAALRYRNMPPASQTSANCSNR